MGYSRGSTHYCATTTEDDVKLMRALYENGFCATCGSRMITIKVIAKKFNLKERTVSDIVAYRTWRHVR